MNSWTVFMNLHMRGLVQPFARLHEKTNGEHLLKMFIGLWKTYHEVTTSVYFWLMLLAKQMLINVWSILAQEMFQRDRCTSNQIPPGPTSMTGFWTVNIDPQKDYFLTGQTKKAEPNCKGGQQDDSQRTHASSLIKGHHAETTFQSGAVIKSNIWD